MTISPGNVSSIRYAGTIKQCWLRQQDKWFFRDFSLPDSMFGGSDFFHRSADVNYTRAPALCRGPGDRTSQSPIHLEHARTIPVAGKLAAVSGWKLIPGDCDQLLWR